jgi:hypothetical protein
LAFCIHGTVSQESENVKPRGSLKYARGLTNDRAINLNGKTESSQPKLAVEGTSDIFDIRKPAKTGPKYDDFLSFLYRNDKAKSKVKREIKREIMTDYSVNQGPVNRGTRALIFR